MTICLPLFLAGGEGDRAFARFYPTIAVDGCELRCAARATEMFSGKPTASIVATELIDQHRTEKPQGARRLNQAGLAAVDFLAGQIKERVDELLEHKWSRRAGNFLEIEPSLVFAVQPQGPVEATCSCGSDIPVRKVMIEGQQVTFIALPLIFEQFRLAGKFSFDGLASELVAGLRLVLAGL